MGPSGKIWDHWGKYGTIGKNMKPSGKLCVCESIPVICYLNGTRPFRGLEVWPEREEVCFQSGRVRGLRRCTRLRTLWKFKHLNINNIKIWDVRGLPHFLRPRTEQRLFRSTGPDSTRFCTWALIGFCSGFLFYSPSEAAVGVASGFRPGYARSKFLLC